MSTLRGKVHRLGANVDTDVIIPARYLNTTDPAELAKHCLEDLDPTFPLRVQKGDIIVADENFGSGSSREHAPVAIRACGVACVVASTFARIFFRNSINVGLPRTMPYFFASLKVAVTQAFVGTVIAETVASNRGIGNLMMIASSSFDVPLVFAGLIILAALGVGRFGFRFRLRFGPEWGHERHSGRGRGGGPPA